MIPQPTTTPEPAQAANHNADYYRRALHRLIDVGGELVEMVHTHAKAVVAAAPPSADVPPPAPAPELIVAFDRIARAIRRCIALARRLDDPPPQAAPDPANQRIAARQRIIRTVEDEIQCHAPEAEIDALQAEFLERLESEDLDDEIADRPVAEIIADICRDLGIAAIPGTHPWKRRTPADIAELCTRAATPATKPRTTLPGFTPPPVPRRTGPDPREGLAGMTHRPNHTARAG